MTTYVCRLLGQCPQPGLYLNAASADACAGTMDLFASTTDPADQKVMESLLKRLRNLRRSEIRRHAHVKQELEELEALLQREPEESGLDESNVGHTRGSPVAADGHGILAGCAKLISWRLVRIVIQEAINRRFGDGHVRLRESDVGA